MIADGWMVGGTSAASMTDDEDPDWGGWQPGDEDTAQDRAGALGLGAGLAAALSRSGETARQMAGSWLTETARALVTGTSAGQAADAVADGITSALAGTATAARFVLNRIVAEVAAAANALYLIRKVQYTRWLTAGDAKVCVICLANSAAGLVKLGDSYPSGDTQPPAHPGGCRCVAAPG